MTRSLLLCATTINTRTVHTNIISERVKIDCFELLLLEQSFERSLGKYTNQR